MASYISAHGTYMYTVHHYPGYSRGAKVTSAQAYHVPINTLYVCV